MLKGSHRIAVGHLDSGHREGLVSQLGLASSVQLLFSIGTDGLSVLRTFNMQEVMKSEVVISRCKS